MNILHLLFAPRKVVASSANTRALIHVTHLTKLKNRAPDEFATRDTIVSRYQNKSGRDLAGAKARARHVARSSATDLPASLECNATHHEDRDDEHRGLRLARRQACVDSELPTGTRPVSYIPGYTYTTFFVRWVDGTVRWVDVVSWPYVGTDGARVGHGQRAGHSMYSENNHIQTTQVPLFRQ